MSFIIPKDIIGKTKTEQGQEGKKLCKNKALYTIAI